jgi:hypothetical protein
MPPTLSRHLNRTLFVSIPGLFEDGHCRPYTLLGVEINGLWLQSPELTDRLLPDDRRHSIDVDAIAAFVPFTQIAGVLVAARAPGESPRPGRTRDERASRPPSTPDSEGHSSAKTQGPARKPPKKR